MGSQKVNVLVVVPRKPTENPEITKKSRACLRSLDSQYPYYVVEYNHVVDSLPTDYTPWSKVCRIRNEILSKLDLNRHSHLLWIDSDIISFPAKLIDYLLLTNPGGVSSPMVLIEDEPEERFYDRSAFILKGTDHIDPTNRSFIEGRNIGHAYPFWDKEYNKILMDMDCVGSVTLVNTDIYKAGTRYEDHPAFTDHYPICLKSRNMGRGVKVNTGVKTYHANLPKYGEKWH